MARKTLSIYCDGGARGNPGPAAAAFVVVDQKGKIIRRESKYLGLATNNEAEYAAVIMGLEWLVVSFPKVSRCHFFLDSELVVKQLKGDYKVKSNNLTNLYLKSKESEKKIKGKISYYSVPREKNRLADFLVNKILDKK